MTFEDYSGGVALLVIAGIVVVSFFSGRERKAERDVIWSAAASALGGAYDSTTEVIRFMALAFTAKVAEVAEGEGVASIVGVNLGCHAAGVLKVSRATLGSKIARFFGVHHITVGDPEFDARFVVKSDPEALALKLFHPDRRSRVILALREASVESVDLSPECLLVKVDGSLSTEKDIVGLAQAAVLLTEGIAGKNVPDQVFEPMEFEPHRGRCPVCGSRMPEQVVLCKECNTPHHEECWRLVRQCSMFGCDEADFVTGPPLIPLKRA